MVICYLVTDSKYAFSERHLFTYLWIANTYCRLKAWVLEVNRRNPSLKELPA